MARIVSAFALFTFSLGMAAEEPLHRRIDSLILAKGKEKPVSALTTDEAFLRRASLDFIGRIPSVAEAKAFLADKKPDKRAILIDRLLGSSEHPRRMQELFHVMLMERMGEHPEWLKYLRDAFAKNVPWDQMARDMLRGGEGGAVFFISKRLEKYGQNPTDYPGLTRDIGRLLLGKDFRCAQCHDHLFIKDYKQLDFQGLFAFVRNVSLSRNANMPGVTEKLTKDKVAYSSVFIGNPKQTGPKIPGLPEIAIPKFKKGEEYRIPPDRKKRTPGVPRFSPLEKLAEQLPTVENAAFARNMANRLWFLLMGRGLVHPLDLHHAANPPSHPELVELLAKAFVDHKFDIRYLLREMALSETYQRSTVLPEGQKHFEPTTFLTAHEKRLSAEQLLWSTLEAIGQREEFLKSKDPKLESLTAKFKKAFANPPREPEETFAPSLRSTLFVLNDPAFLQLLDPDRSKFIQDMAKLGDEQAIEHLYLAILTRMPLVEERKGIMAHLKSNAKRRAKALSQIAWALLTSTEFCVNH